MKSIEGMMPKNIMRVKSEIRELSPPELVETNHNAMVIFSGMTATIEASARDFSLIKAIAVRMPKEIKSCQIRCVLMNCPCRFEMLVLYLTGSRLANIKLPGSKTWESVFAGLHLAGGAI